MKKRTATLASLFAVGVLALSAGCSSGGGSGSGSGSGSGKTVITFMEDTPANSKESLTIRDLSAQYTKLHPNVTLQFEYVPQQNINQKIQLLAAQNDLPTLFSAGSATAIAKGLSKDGLLLNVAATFRQLGIYNAFTPVGVSLVQGVYGVPMVGIPKEADIDGFWYNKKIFAQDGITVPSTWSQLVSDAATLQSKGVQPFVTPGSPTVGWPITRMIGEYIERELGADAMTPVVQGKATLTDAPYLAGANAIASLGAKGYFGKGVASTDYPTGVSEFLTGPGFSSGMLS
jgi:raffinose/stachyose/melibiose transport system substrate-binding protein